MKRNNIKEKSGVKSPENIKYTPLQLHYMGLKGEIATIKNCGGSWDELYTFTGLKGDNKIDTVINGRTYAIKTRDYRNAWLFFDDLDDFIADRAILCELVNPLVNNTVAIVGWIDRADFMRCHFVKNFGFGTRYIVTEAQLRPIQEILDGK